MNSIVKPKILGAVWKVFCCIMKYECCDYIEMRLGRLEHVSVAHGILIMEG